MQEFKDKILELKENISIKQKKTKFQLKIWQQ